MRLLGHRALELVISDPNSTAGGRASSRQAKSRIASAQVLEVVTTLSGASIVAGATSTAKDAVDLWSVTASAALTAQSVSLSATATASSTAFATNASITAVPANYKIPQAFDSTLGTAFSSTACPSFFANFLADPTFLACAPFSLLLSTSTAFFTAEKSPSSLLPYVLNATCTPDVDICSAKMASLATQIRLPSTCGPDLALSNALAVEALMGFQNYDMMRQAGCQKSNTTGEYCFAAAAAEKPASELYFYYLPTGTSLPSGTAATCGGCTQGNQFALDMIFLTRSMFANSPLGSRTSIVSRPHNLRSTKLRHIITMRSTMRTSSSISMLAWIGVAQAHMSPFMLSMYGIGGTRTGTDWEYTAGDPVSPIGPGVATQDAWWFRGPGYRALTPPAGAVTMLPAGGTVTLDITCRSSTFERDVAWSGVGWRTTVPGSALDACPGGTAGAYHAGDPSAYAPDPTLISGCAIGVADVDNIADVTMDNLAIVSVQQDCVAQRLTDFSIPAMMPACTGSKCICGWFWLANTGTANFYMTAFDCNVTNANPAAKPVAALSDAVYCATGDTSCTTTSGAKRPLYAYNTPTNVVYPTDSSYVFNNDRPGYHDNWSFKNGAQNDIFQAAAAPIVSSVKAAAASITAAPNARQAAISSRIAAAQLATREAAIAARKSAAAAAAKTQNARRAAPTQTPGSMCTAIVPCDKVPEIMEQVKEAEMLDDTFASQMVGLKGGA
ncbi:hypothetical protein P7C70_g2793, partial [Phenoliferia sp. Uapishka_3]